jgi:hypothetical protein
MVQQREIDRPLAEELVLTLLSIGDLLEVGACRPTHSDFPGICVHDGRFDLLADGLAPRHR